MCLGIPARILSITDDELGMALVESNGVQRQISVAMLAVKQHELSSLVGQWVLLHVGFAMAIIDERQAIQSLELLARMGGERIDARL